MLATISANITNLRSTCDETGANIVSNVTFDVQARRRDASAARDVTLEYFAVVVQGGTNVISKSVGRVGVHFAAGQLRVSAEVRLVPSERFVHEIEDRVAPLSR